MAQHKKNEANLKLKEDKHNDKKMLKRTTTKLRDEISELDNKKEVLEKLIENALNEKKEYSSVVGYLENCILLVFRAH